VKPLESATLVVFDAPNVAMPVGSLPPDQFVPVLKSFDPGLASQVAS
jgi:hypothetical protein